MMKVSPEIEWQNEIVSFTCAVGSGHARVSFSKPTIEKAAGRELSVSEVNLLIEQKADRLGESLYRQSSEGRPFALVDPTSLFD